MGKNTTTDLIVKVPDYDVTTQTFLQHGMRYPNGTIKWVQAQMLNGNVVNFQSLAAGVPSHKSQWDHALQQQAKSARIDLDKYIEGHQPVKRTVILAVAGVEEV